MRRFQVPEQFRKGTPVRRRFSGLSAANLEKRKPGAVNPLKRYMAKKSTKKPVVAMDADRAKMMAMYEETLKTFTEGALVKGQIVEIRPQEVLINIGYKSEGLLPASEF